ncbi:clathrin heavy chain linker domain-containing protein 1-like [Tubulanus polymorphus]|uniref:clathrin heavy chain linker domain-containing protein 1-like n=1 Tax=Tubulanus polymorphus TaxID=672921 RepID=UPI003DA6B52D
MLSETCTPCSSPHPVLPPIIRNERDRLFLQSLTKDIDHELRKISDHHPDQRYALFRKSFDKVIDHVTAYKPILTAIQAEYEECIETIIRGNQQAFYLNGKLKALASEPTTMRNYKKRIDELEQRISVIRDNNQQLAGEIEDLSRIKEEREYRRKQVEEPPKKIVKKDSRQIPGLTIEQNTDIELLKKELTKVDKQLKELRHSERAKYQPREIKESLRVQLSYKADLRDTLINDDEYLKERMNKLKVALEAARVYNEICPPHQTIGEVITAALHRDVVSEAQKKDQESKDQEEKARLGPAQLRRDTVLSERETSLASVATFEDDDPAREQEADVILDYIEKFNELFDNEKYEAAAIHAANSPKGILRNMETLLKFKVAVAKDGEREPLLAYCDAIMSSVLAIGVIPSEEMCIECVQTALANNRLDLLLHWIAQDRLKMTEQVGDLVCKRCMCQGLCSCGCQGMAQKVYTAVAAHDKVIGCMLHQGRVISAVEYAERKASYDQNKYAELLEAYPSPQLAQALFRPFNDGSRHLPLGVVVRILLHTNLYEQGFLLLKDVITNREGSDDLHNLIFEDNVTTENEWIDIANKCENHGFENISVELLAAITVTSAMTLAASIIDYTKRTFDV